MQIYLYQNNQQEGPFTLPRISARLVSGDLDSATPAWHQGLDTWYPLNHDKWKELGIVAPPPKSKPPVQKEEVAEALTEDNQVGESGEDDLVTEGDNQVVNDPQGDEEAEKVEEVSGPAFASYTEEDFKLPSYEEMESEMAELRSKRAGFPEAIGRRVHEINFRDEDIEDAWAALDKALAAGKGESKAFASLGQAVLSAGLNDPALDELRDEEQDVADRMLNLQMQLRRMGGGKRVKKPSSWMKWAFVGFVILVIGGVITAIILSK
jgi:hypothetical protein